MSKEISRRDFLKGSAACAMGVAGMSLLGYNSPVAEAAGPEEEVIVPDKVLDCDVVVAGLGVSGMVAASRAAQLGANVIGLDPAIASAGTNACAIYGSFSLESSDQVKYPNYVTKKEFFDHIYEGTFYQSNAQLLSHMCDVLGPAFDMMLDGGITVVPGYREAVPEDPIGVRTGFFFEKTGAERGEQIQGMLDKYGVNCMWRTHATSLIKDSTGAVTGVYAKNADGTVYQINAKGGVVLCCGGFVHNAELVNKYFSGCEMMSISNTFDKGDGINMATAVGGQMGKNISVSMYEFSGSHPNDPKTGFNSANEIMYPERIGNLFVNKRGERFMNEQWMVTRTMFCSEPLIREGGKYYLIYDNAMMKDLSTKSLLEITGDGVLNAPGDVGGAMIAPMVLSNIYEEADTAIKQGFCWKADTIEELAKTAGLENLPETVAKYNEFCETGADTQMHKDAKFLHPIKEGPFYAVECVLNSWVTLGGLKTDGDCRVLTNSGETIPGLYVAGADCDAWAVPYYQVTTTSGFSFATAYISAEDAVKRSKE